MRLLLQALWPRVGVRGVVTFWLSQTKPEVDPSAWREREGAVEESA